MWRKRMIPVAQRPPVAFKVTLRRRRPRTTAKERERNRRKQAAFVKRQKAGERCVMLYVTKEIVDELVRLKLLPPDNYPEHHTARSLRKALYALVNEALDAIEDRRIGVPAPIFVLR
jgi:hypothetical protein